MTFRGDRVFAGLVYTVIGLAAVAMTTSAPLMPFFFPVVAGVGFLGPLAAVGFDELARRREAGERDVHWFNFLDVLKRPSLDDMGIVAGLLLLIFFVWLIAAGALYVALFDWTPPTSISQFLSMVFLTARGWALIIGGAVIGAIFGWFVLALSVVSPPMPLDRNVSAAEAVSASWRAAHENKGEMIRWGLIVLGPPHHRLDPAVRRPGVRAAVARLFDLAPLHPPGRPRTIFPASMFNGLSRTFSSRKRMIVVHTWVCGPLAGDRMVAPG